MAEQVELGLFQILSHLSILEYLKKILKVKNRPAFNLPFGNFCWISFWGLLLQILQIRVAEDMEIFKVRS